MGKDRGGSIVTYGVIMTCQVDVGRHVACMQPSMFLEARAIVS